MATFKVDLRDAVTPRAFILVVGVLFLQLAFVLSYVGAFHSPEPNKIPVGVVADAQTAPKLVAQLNGIDGHPVSAKAIGSKAEAADQIKDNTINAALVVSPSGTDQLLTSSGAGSSVLGAVEAVFQQAEAQQGRKLTTQDLVPLQAHDARGLTGFYLVIGWMVGGYLVASLLGVAGGARPANTRRAAIRLGSLVPYAIVSGLGGAIIVDPVLGALTGHFMALWWIGALIVFASAAATTALQVLFGIVGIGLAVLLFVVLGNPSAGGAFQLHLLPPFWRAIGYILPTGAGTDAVRRIVYFGGAGIGGHVLTLALWAVIGTAVALGAAAALRSNGETVDAEPATAE